jgi:RHS repeat-associated protein
VGPDAGSGNSGNPIQYTSRENDATGLNYYRARYYDAVLKRFVSSDPIGLKGGLNTYAYVEGNPITYVDPRGLATCSCHTDSVGERVGEPHWNGQQTKLCPVTCTCTIIACNKTIYFGFSYKKDAGYGKEATCSGEDIFDTTGLNSMLDPFGPSQKIQDEINNIANKCKKNCTAQ